MKINLELPKIVTNFDPGIDTALYIIYKDIKNYKFAVIENFIDTMFDIKLNCASFFYGYSYMTFQCFDYTRILPGISSFMIMNFSDFIVSCIDNGYYIVYIPDIYYINQYKINHHMQHELLIYGYDNSNKMFLTRDYFDFKLPSDEYISFDTLNKTLKLPHNTLYRNYIHCLNLDPFKIRKSNIDLLILKLENFLNCSVLSDVEDKYYGISFFKILERQLLNKEILSFRIKNYHFICAHISLMLERVKLIELDHDINLSIIKLELEILVKKSFLLRNSIMKIIPQIEQNILRTNTYINIQQKFDIISKLRQQYTDVLTKLVDELKTYSRKSVLQT